MLDTVAPLLDAPPLRRYGLPQVERGASPAVATDFVQAIDGRYYARLLSVFVRLVTDANVADRNVSVEYRDPEDNRLVLCGAPVSQTASSTNDWAFNAWQAQAEWPVDSTILVPLAPFLLSPGYDFRIHVENVQAGDQLSRVRFTWELFYSDSAELL